MLYNFALYDEKWQINREGYDTKRRGERGVTQLIRPRCIPLSIPELEETMRSRMYSSVGGLLLDLETICWVEIEEPGGCKASTDEAGYQSEGLC